MWFGLVSVHERGLFRKHVVYNRCPATKAIGILDHLIIDGFCHPALWCQKSILHHKIWWFSNMLLNPFKKNVFFEKQVGATSNAKKNETHETSLFRLHRKKCNFQVLEKLSSLSSLRSKNDQDLYRNLAKHIYSISRPSYI